MGIDSPNSMTLFVFIGFLLGACLGSFLNVLAHRTPRGLSVVLPRSQCLGCSSFITWRDNLPILGWLLLKGRARCCGAKIPIRYFGVEIVVALCFAWFFSNFLAHGDIGFLVSSCFFLWILVGVIVTDLETMLIPDRLSVGGAGVGLVLSIIFPDLHGTHSYSHLNQHVYGGILSLVAILVGSGLLYWIGAIAGMAMQREALGEGDIKLVGCIGAFCGWKGAIFSIFGGALLGCLILLPLFVLQRLRHRDGDGSDSLNWGKEIPFGPYLAIAGLIYFFGINATLGKWFDWLGYWGI